MYGVGVADKYDLLNQKSGNGSQQLVIPPFPALVLPDAVKRAFPEFAKNVDDHANKVEDWRKQVNVAVFGIVPP